MSELIDHKKYADQLPCVKAFADGVPVTLSQNDINKVSDWVAAGVSLDCCAIELDLCERDFKRVCKVNLRLQAAIRRGRSLNRNEYMVTVREAALTCKNSDLTKWYGKQAFGMADKVDQNVKNSGNVVLVNTGVPASLPADQGNIIEHDNG